MHIRYRYVTYRYTDGSQQQLDRHYRQLLHDALRQSHQSILQRSATWRPLADIRESAEMMTIKIELAGMREEEIEVTLYEDALVISGERHDTKMVFYGLTYQKRCLRAFQNVFKYSRAPQNNSRRERVNITCIE